MAPSWLIATSASQVQTILMPQPPEELGLKACTLRHHTKLTFVFSVEVGFHHVGQDVLSLLTFDPPASASQSAGITGVNHHARSK